jgi:hypothetical protein
MTGHNVFDQITAFADTVTDRVNLSISQEDFDLWQQDVIWDALHGIRYGQSFCNRFGITDNLLYYTNWPPEQLNDYIRKHYVDRSRI